MPWANALPEPGADLRLVGILSPLANLHRCRVRARAMPIAPWRFRAAPIAVPVPARFGRCLSRAGDGVEGHAIARRATSGIAALRHCVSHRDARSRRAPL